ncbi:hypothetical protein SAMN05192529_106150 [Arachidicoccus rhizosphaerae]|uniref:Uncharacterized protein n=1 Tax=Arachidicoccus rhizosphaerae TaxID=551991 RepID=A0A1H3XVH3_9BACT|nr:DUF6686 family protein [Arachidicoccus rhizosphaerae]SEA03313.1 hypothetical protein SAMN05192529_106150 [Arachidicoccus rhizosphaerae]
MCDFNNLSSSENGFILRCRQCGYYQIGFAGVMLSLNIEDYTKFCQLIEHLATKQVPVEKWSARHIVIPTPYYGVNMLLCKHEIDDLSQLISKADSEQLAQSMMAMLTHG